MKFIAGLVFVICCTAVNAASQFQIPRSSIIELTELDSNRVYPVFVKLPRSYHKNKNKHYPVIYLTDGSYAFQLASGITRYPMNIGKMEEAIIVAISYEKGSKGASSRIRDYTPNKASSWKLDTGNAQGHARFLEKQIIPYIESNYRVTPSERTYVGNSLGGLFGAYLLLKKPELFNNYIIGSPSVWFNNHYILSVPATNKAIKANVYLAVGELEKPEHGEQQDMVDGAQLLVKHIEQQFGENVLVKFKLLDDATHATAFPTTLVLGLDWLFGVKN
ncbi:alpha/beta hydrolase [Thalassotalea marina]|uniref:Esterase n=1 Tax=Thalassotalea marina TaxID=1673741 RepID=A0A919BRX6_9GAMM|nr:alpha/beta hydrolase-fold protein [Thalassotalea marina]GHG06075.1 esterase [Thalassotalea marina]